MRVVYVGVKFKILRNKKDYIIVRNTNNFYNEHGHFKTFYGARECVHLLEKGVLPKNDYYLKCASRLLSAEEFEGLKPRG